MKNLSIPVIILLGLSPALAQETISPEILRQLQQLDDGYRSPCKREMLLYKRSYLQTLKEIETVLGEQQCWSEPILLSDLIAEFNPNETTIDRILAMSQEIGLAIVSCQK